MDRRSERWTEHRASRRAQLVAAAVAAVDDVGASATIADIAASAGVAKPVLYRYFADKNDLYRAVGDWAVEEVLDAVWPPLLGQGPLRGRVSAACRAYLAAIDEHPNVFFLLVEHHSEEIAGGKERIAATFTRAFDELLRGLGLDAAGAEAWAHGIVGLGLAHGEWWMRRRTLNLEVSAEYLATFIWNAFEGFAREHGIDLAAVGER